MADRGFAMIRPEEGLHACDRLLRYDRHRTGYLPTADGTWIEALGEAARRSAFFAPQLPDRGGAGSAGADHDLLADLADLEPAEKLTRLTEFVLAQAAGILRIDPGGIDPARSLLDHGLDSLMGLELRTRIDKALGVRVPTKKLWAHPEPVALAEHLAGLLDDRPD